MLVMSDVAGPGVASLGLPYLTGYPLAESGMYALAKTWPAPEMSRPGCVWTHTVLIGFADLAALAAPSTVAGLFQRPTTPSLDVYSRSVLVEPNEHFVGRPFSPAASSWFAKLASAVYEHPDAQVWARRSEGDEVDEAVLRLWDQQWPRLKRSFRFCTLTSRDRSQEGMPFDLQLISGSESSSHLHFASTADGFEATSKSTGPWLDDLLHDAQFPQTSTLRPFLRKLGADMLGGREAMRPFCSLHAALESTDTVGVSDAIRRVELSPVFSASTLVRSIVTQAAMANFPSAVDDHVLDFVIDNFALLPETVVSEKQASLVQMLWRRDPRRLLHLSNDAHPELRDAIRAGVDAIPADEVIDKLSQVDDLALPLLSLLPATAEVPHFWERTQLLPTLAAQAGVDLTKDAVLRAMMLGLTEPISIQAAVRVVGSVAALNCLQCLAGSSNVDYIARPWLRFVCADLNAVAQFLTNESAPTSKLLLLLAATLDPDAVPNDVGVDPWYTALNRVTAAEGQLPFELQVFGFRRALGWRSRSVAELLKLTFEPLHAAAVSDNFPEQQWRLFESSLPWAPFGQQWDFAIRLRRATARKCAELHLWADSLTQLVRSDDLFLQLVEEIWNLWGGSKYLRSLCDSLDQSAPRTRLLRTFIKKHSKPW